MDMIDDEENRRIITVFFGGVLVLGSAVALVCTLKPCQLFGRIKASLQNARKRIASFREAETDEVGLLVQAKMQQLKVDHFEWCLQACCAAITPMTAYGVYNAIFDQPRPNSFGQDVIHVFLHGLFLVVVMLPRVVSLKTIDCFYGTLVFAGAMQASPFFCNGSTALSSTTWAVCFVNVLGLTRRSALRAAIYNSVVAATVVSTLMTKGRTAVDRPALTAAWQVSVLVMFPALTYMIDVSIGMGIRRSIETQDAKETLSAVCALLRTCCDVVTKLDHEGIIESEGTVVGSFLLRGTGYDLQGTRLSELFSNVADKTKFQNKLKEPKPSGSGLADAMHVRVRDGNNKLIRLELLLFQFSHVDGQPHFMVGIREFTDTTAHDVDHTRTTDLEEQDQVDVDVRGISGNCSDSSSLSIVGDMPPESELPAVLAVDSHCAGFHIRECSRGFRHRVGRLPLGTCFAPLVQRKEDFSCWMQVAVNTALYGEDEPPCSVTINMRHGPVKAQCRLLRTDLNGAEQALNPEHVRLLLFNIRQCNNLGRGGADGRSPMQMKGTPVVHMSL